MKIYKVTFNEYNSFNNRSVKNDINDNYIITDKSNVFLIKEEDILYAMAYGKGIKTMEYVGELTEGWKIENGK